MQVGTSLGLRKADAGGAKILNAGTECGLDYFGPCGARLFARNSPLCDRFVWCAPAARYAVWRNLYDSRLPRVQYSICD